MRASKYTVKPTSQFKKDYKLAMKRGLDISLLEDIIAKLALGESLPEKNRDHALSGNWNGYRECHILPDWLLIYKLEDNVLILTLARTGPTVTYLTNNPFDKVRKEFALCCKKRPGASCPRPLLCLA